MVLITIKRKMVVKDGLFHTDLSLSDEEEKKISALGSIASKSPIINIADDHVYISVIIKAKEENSTDELIYVFV